METHKVTLGDIVLHGYADMPDPFSGLVVSAINGWRGLPGARGDGDSIPGAHGSYQTTTLLREGRSIELRGAAIGSTEAEALGYLGRLESEVAGRPVVAWVYDAEGAYSRIVEVNNVQVVGAYNRDRVVFAIDAYAPDPRRYRAPITVGPIGLPIHEGGLVLPEAFPWDFGTLIAQSLTVENDGEVPIFPVVTVTGDAAAVVISGGPRRMAFGSFDGTLVFDSLNRRAKLNGSDVTRLLPSRNWFTVEPGSSADFYFEATDAAEGISLTVEYRIGAW